MLLLALVFIREHSFLVAVAVDGRAIEYGERSTRKDAA
jgi:hypothetical protein